MTDDQTQTTAPAQPPAVALPADAVGALELKQLQLDARIGLALMREFAPGMTLTAADIDMLRALSALVMTNATGLHYPPDAPPTFGEVVGRTLAAAFAMGRARTEAK